MGVRAGDIRQCTISGREMDIKGEDANVNIRTSGYNNEVGINGNGTTHVTQRRKTAGFSDLQISLDDTRKDLEFLQGIIDDGDAVPVNITLASGVTYSGALVIVGDLEKATGDGTVSIEMRGARFEQI
jgi:hypothetical protein